MSKGLGAILAEIDMMKKKAALEGLEAPACPLCGEPMESDGAGWFCYADEGNKCPRISEAEDRFDGYVDEFQGQTLAAIVDESESRLLAELRTVRGPYAKTNLRVSVCEGVDDAGIPELSQRYGWVFMEWMGDGWAAQKDITLTRVVLSSPILIEDGTFRRKTIPLDEAEKWVEAHTPENFSGHETVKIVGLDPAEDRRNCEGYDEALILQPNERLEWGKEYSVEEIGKIGVTAVMVTRIA